MTIRFAWCVLLLLVSGQVWAQPGCRTVVLPEFVNPPGSVETVVWVPPTPPGTDLLYPFNYITPSNGVTTGVETLFYRLNGIPWGDGVAVWYQGDWRAVPKPVHVIPYQTLPHVPPVSGEPFFAYKKQHHYTIWPKLQTSWAGFDNYSVVLQPPRNGLTGEGWNVGILNENDFPVPIELQVFFRECVTP